MSNNVNYQEFINDLQKTLSSELTQIDKFIAIYNLSKNLSTDIGKQIEKQESINEGLTGEEIAKLYESYSDVVRFTKALKKKLDNIPEGIKEALIKEIQVNGISQEVVNGIVDIIIPSKAFLIKYQIPADGISDETNGGTLGRTTFDLPSDFDISKTSFGQDGGMLAQYTIDSANKTITFSIAPLANTCFLFYYPL